MAEIVRHEISEILERFAAGEVTAKADLFDRVYKELHMIAYRRMNREQVPCTLGPSDLVNEVFAHMNGPSLLRGHTTAIASSRSAHSKS